MKKRIIIFACQQIGVDFIKYISGLNNIEIALVVTYELLLDKTYRYQSVLDECKKMGIRVENPPYVTDSIMSEILSLSPDLIFSVYYRKIFPKSLLSIPKQGCINIHPSKLPAYRGPTPTAWALKNGEKSFGLTIHLMDEGIDTGDILIQKEFPIYDEETGYELYTRGMKLGAEMLKEYFYKIVEGELVPKKQIGPGSYYGKLTGKHTIDWKQEAEEINNIIRVHAKPYNPAETILFNRYVLVNKARVIRDMKYPAQGAGIMLDILGDKKIIVSCADGCLILEEYEIVPALTEEEEEIYLRIGNRLG